MRVTTDFSNYLKTRERERERERERQMNKHSTAHTSMQQGQADSKRTAVPPSTIDILETSLTDCMWIWYCKRVSSVTFFVKNS